jgi:cell division protein FtsQ
MALQIKGTYIRIAWVVFLFLVICGLFSAISNKKKASVDQLKVNINPIDGEFAMLTSQEVDNELVKTLGINVKGVPVGKLDLERIEAVVKTNPYVKDADVYVNTNNQLEVNLTQKIPILRVMDNNGNQYYLDDLGAKIPISKHYSPRVLIVSGGLPPYQSDFQTAGKSMLSNVFLLTKYINEHEFWKAMIDQIHVNGVGDILLIPQIGQQKILFGNIENIDEKFHRLELFYKEAMSTVGWNKYEILDVRFKGQVVCK